MLRRVQVIIHFIIFFRRSAKRKEGNKNVFLFSKYICYNNFLLRCQNQIEIRLRYNYEVFRSNFLKLWYIKSWEVEDYLSRLKFRNWQRRRILSRWKMEKSHSRGRLSETSEKRHSFSSTCLDKTTLRMSARRITSRILSDDARPPLLLRGSSSGYS